MKTGSRNIFGIAFRSITTGIAAFCILGAASPGEAITFPRVWVSPNGNDSNIGTTTSPVQTLSKAYMLTAQRGEINVRDSGDFTGGLIITKPLTIDGGGCQTGIRHTADVSAGLIITNGANVTLRNLSFNGHGVGNAAINISNGATVNVENCTFAGSVDGVFAVGQSTSYVRISNCTFKNITEHAIMLSTNAGNMFATIENVEISNCGIGVNALNGARFTLRNSSLNSNGFGIYMNQSGASSKGAVDNCMLTNNSTALRLGSLCTARVIETSFVQNNVLFENAGGGVFESDGTNTKISNATAGPAPAPLPNF